MKKILFALSLAACLLFSLPAFAENTDEKISSAVSSAAQSAPVFGKTENLSASSTAEDGIILTWDDVPGAKGYQVFANDGMLSQFAEIGSSKSNAIRIASLEAGTTYDFKVRAVKKTEDGKTVYGEFSDVLSASTAPGPVKSIDTEDIEKDSVTLCWSKAKGATHYEVYIFDRAKNKFVIYGAVENECRLQVSGLDENRIYTFKIRPVRVTGTQSAFGAFSKEYSEFTDTGYVPYTNAQAARRYNTAVNAAKSMENGTVDYLKAVETGVNNCSKNSLLRTCKNLMKVFDGKLHQKYIFKGGKSETAQANAFIEPYNREAALNGSDIYSFSFKKTQSGEAMKIKLKSETVNFDGKTKQPPKNKGVMTAVKLEKKKITPIEIRSAKQIFDGTAISLTTDKNGAAAALTIESPVVADAQCRVATIDFSANVTYTVTESYKFNYASE